MKKLLVAILIAAMTLTMSSMAFAEEAAVEGDTITINFTQFQPEGQYFNSIANAFCDYVDEHSNGTIIINRQFGGSSAFQIFEEFDALLDGAVDMAAPLQSFVLDTDPFIYGMDVLGGPEDIFVMDKMLTEENEATAKIIADFNDSLGIHYLGTANAGSVIFFSSEDVKTLDDFSKTQFGVQLNIETYQNMGWNCLNLDIDQTYDGLQRGVCNAACCSTGNYLSYHMEEVAPYVVNANLYGAAMAFCISKDKWDAMSPSQQQVMNDAMKAAQDFSVKADAQFEADVQANEKVLSYTVMDESDTYELCKAFAVGYSKTMIEFGKINGMEEEIKTYIDARSEYLGMDLYGEASQ